VVLPGTAGIPASHLAFPTLFPRGENHFPPGPAHFPLGPSGRDPGENDFPLGPDEFPLGTDDPARGESLRDLGETRFPLVLRHGRYDGFECPDSSWRGYNSFQEEQKWGKAM
jgi:hypothetical protein